MGNLHLPSHKTHSAHTMMQHHVMVRGQSRHATTAALDIPCCSLTQGQLLTEKEGRAGKDLH